MGQVAIINKLKFDKAKQRNPELLKRLDCILFPQGEKSFLKMDVEEANEALAEGFEQRIHKGSIPGNLKYFGEQFSSGTVQINLTDSVQNMLNAISEHADIFKANIERYSE